MYNQNNKYKNNNAYRNKRIYEEEQKNFRKNNLLHQQYERQLEENEFEDDFDDEYDDLGNIEEEGDDSELSNYDDTVNTNNMTSQGNQQSNNIERPKRKKVQKNKKGLNKNKSLNGKSKRRLFKGMTKKRKNIKRLRKVKSFFYKLPIKYKLIFILGAIILFIVGLIFLMGFDIFDSDSGSGSGSSAEGYYDEACDFNNTTVNYTDGTNTYEGLSLDDFVIGATYIYFNESDYSDEIMKALLVIIKTNALSYGNYSNSSQILDLSNDTLQYVSEDDMDSDKKDRLYDLYNLISDEIYLSNSYSGTINSLSSSDALTLDDSSITKIEEMYNSAYKEILDKLYNTDSSKQIYKISDNCTYYTITENNDAFWWPIGSSEETSKNIYGGIPTATHITSYFGPRNVPGASSNHGAIDIGASCNADVVIATKSGVVTKTSDTCDNNGYAGNQCGGRWGNHVTIDHGDGITVTYAHLYPGSISVKKGDNVAQGQKIGLVGNSGSSTGCHLHFEVILNGQKVDPLNYVSVDNPRSVSEYNISVVADNVSTPEETKTAICNSLLKSGFSKNSVAGMMVNIKAEGSFKLNNLEGCYEENECCTVNGKPYGFCQHPEIKGFGSDEKYTAGVDSGEYPKDKFVNDRAGYGLIQWTSSGRKKGLYEMSKDKGLSIATLDVQLTYLLKELKSSGYKITYKYITGNYSAEEIAKNFCLDFESPNDEKTVCPNRASENTASMLTYVENGCK